jgi:hypothetical protein
MLASLNDGNLIVDIDEYEKQYIDYSLVYNMKAEGTDSTADLECPICFDIFRHPITLKCMHTFCKECLDLTGDHRCALCRKYYSRWDIKINIEILKQIDNLTTACKICKSTGSAPTHYIIKCSVCNNKICALNKRNHIYNKCGGRGILKYCFVCKKHVIKSRYGEHKKVCYDPWFRKRFAKLNLYDDGDDDNDISNDNVGGDDDFLTKRNSYYLAKYKKYKEKHIKLMGNGVTGISLSTPEYKLM